MNPSEILNRRRFVSTAKKAPYWAGVNLISMVIFLIEMKLSFVKSLLSFVLVQYIILIFEIILTFLFFINISYNIYIYIYFKRFMQPIKLTKEEFELFGVDPKEIGFDFKENIDKGTEIDENKYGQANKTPPFTIIPNSWNLNSPSTKSIQNSGSLSANSWAFKSGPHLDDSSIDSGLYKRSDSHLRNKSLNEHSPFQSDLRLRKSHSFLSNSLLKNRSSSDDFRSSPRKNITSTDDLKRFLEEQESREDEFQELIQAEKRLGYDMPSSMAQNSDLDGSMLDNSHHNLSMSFLQTAPPKFHDLSVSNSPMTPKSLFNTSSPVNPFNDSSKFLPSPTTNSPSVSAYKPSIKISTQPSPEKSESLNSSTRTVEKILKKLDVDDVRLNQMVENIRKWISQTILARLVQEFDSINKTIVEKGYIDSLIGETSLKQLKYLVESKRSEFPTLEQVFPFLDVKNVRNIENNIPFQQYLVRRLKDLAKGGCMIEFLWDGGGSYNYKPWKDDMITDSELIMHIFCVYMDSRLLFNPTIPEGRPFTSQYFKPYQSTKPIKSDTYIQQEKAYPPHFSLILKSDLIEIPPGRNNLFYSLLVFIHHIKVKNFGLLGRINLGPSGLNIAWVIDNNDSHKKRIEN